MTPTPPSVEARHAIRDHLRPVFPAASSEGSLPHLEKVRDHELQAAHAAVSRALSSIRTELAVLAANHVGCGLDVASLRLEKEFLALAMRMEDVLELARLRLDDGAVHLQPLMLDQTVRAAVEDAAASLRATGIHIDLHTQNDVAVTGDVDRLREVALRFLDLGVRAVPEGGRLQVRVVGSEGRGRLEAETPGLAAAIEASVGLRVCRTLAAMLGGRLEQSPDRLSFSLPVLSVRRRLPDGLADARFL